MEIRLTGIDIFKDFRFISLQNFNILLEGSRLYSHIIVALRKLSHLSSVLRHQTISLLDSVQDVLHKISQEWTPLNPLRLFLNKMFFFFS